MPLQPVQVHPRTKQGHETAQERSRESAPILRLLLPRVLRADRSEPLFQRLLPVRGDVLGDVFKIDMIRRLARFDHAKAARVRLQGGLPCDNGAHYKRQPNQENRVLTQHLHCRSHSYGTKIVLLSSRGRVQRCFRSSADILCAP